MIGLICDPDIRLKGRKKGFYHDIIITGGGKAAGKLFPWVHVVIGNLKRFLLGTHHYVGKNHIDGYIAEYVYRLNRRFHEEDLFNHLFQACLLLPPKPKKSLKK
ncbi:MAG: transposase [Syntrophales bacterium]|nr:transposase [Syntrophales bacterium]